MTRHKMVLRLVFMLAPVVAIAIGRAESMDAFSKEDEFRIRLEEALARYKQLSKVEYPTTKDVVFTLRRLDPTGRSYGESLTALELIRLGYFTQEELIEPVRTLYDKSDEKPTLKASCVSAMLKLDPEQGLKLARYILDDRTSEAELKLSVAAWLARAGHTDGFPLVLKALETASGYDYTLAKNAALALRELDGKPVPGTTETVSVEKLEAAIAKRPPGTPTTKPSETK